MTSRRTKNEKLAVRATLSSHPRPPGPWKVLLERVGPKYLDSDNLAGALKAVRDAVACWLEVDDADGPGAPVSWCVGQRVMRDQKHVRVMVKTREHF